MYIPKLYREEDRDVILNFLQQNNFPALVSNAEGRLLASHLPVEVVETDDGGLTIYGHMSRANPQWKSFDGQEVLLIFQGPHSYISPRWYGHTNVPTWNYTNVHLYGVPRILEGADVYKVLSRLVGLHEQNTGYNLESLPQDFVEKEMKGTLVFEVQVTSLDAGYKLSQNRNDADHENIIHELNKRPDETSHQVAAAMKEQRARTAK
jgi:transcriptional regulator